MTTKRITTPLKKCSKRMLRPCLPLEALQNLDPSGADGLAQLEKSSVLPLEHHDVQCPGMAWPRQGLNPRSPSISAVPNDRS